MMAQAQISDHAAIGDGRSVALVSKDGSVDWLCWPRFDSPSVFAALLDGERGGAWRVAPAGAFGTTRRYLDGTNVLETTFHTATGTAVLTDAMTYGGGVTLRPAHELLRRVACTGGSLLVDARFEPRPDYGRVAGRVRAGGVLGAKVEGLRGELTLRSGVDHVASSDGALTARFCLRAGEHADFSLCWDDEAPAVLLPLGDAARARLDATVSAWRAWAGAMRYRGEFEGQVRRSALVMKLLSCAPSGALLAAPTTSLPERVGGDLNWDYRYCWLRDAAFATRAYFALGYLEEGRAFCEWLLNATRLTLPQVRVVYDEYGQPLPRERALWHLSGYWGSRPVRVGNAASEQLQLDTYGEVIDALFQLLMGAGRIDRTMQKLLRELGHFVAEHWREPDRGIWEVRGAPKHYTHSRVLCWTALDRLVRLSEAGLLERLPVQRLAAERDAIREEVEARGFDEALFSYTQAYGEQTVDASLLLLPWYGYAAPDSPRMAGTWRRLRERLEPEPGLIYRNEESFPAGEGAFGICAFWAAEFLARGGGSRDEARALFQHALESANELGLFAEECAPGSRSALGNYPQAYTHVGLINAACALSEARA